MSKSKNRFIVIDEFKINEEGTLKEYRFGDLYYNKNKTSIEYLKQIKKIK